MTVKQTKLNIISALLLLVALAIGLTAQATVTQSIVFKGRAVNGNYIFMIGEPTPMYSSGAQQGTSVTFNNQTVVNQANLQLRISGTLSFAEANDNTNVTTNGTVMLTFYSPTGASNPVPTWFCGATVKNNADDVQESSYSISDNNSTITVTIPNGTSFYYVELEQVTNPPITNSNTGISGIDGDYIYIGSAIKPVPTVTYSGTVLTEGTDYTVSYANNKGAGTATLTVTGMGDYAGTATANFTIRHVALSDFTSLDDNTYEIATKEDLRNLACYVNYAGNDCQGLTFRQTDNFDFDNKSNIPIGDNEHSFCGTYDGNRKVINRIEVNHTGQAASDSPVGVFGKLGPGGVVKDFRLGTSILHALYCVGGIVGYNQGGTVLNCEVSGTNIYSATSSPDNTCFGVIVGRNEGMVAGCRSGASLLDKSPASCCYFGGIVGYNSGTVRDCVKDNRTLPESDHCGSIAGNNDNGTLSNNYHHSDVGGVNGADCDGARLAHQVNLSSDLALVGEEIIYNSRLTAIGSIAIKDNGKIYSGATQTISLVYTGTVPDGYEFSGIRVKDSDNNDVPVTESSGIYTFVMPDKSVTVTIPIVLNDNDTGNTRILEGYNGVSADVTLSGRTLWKDGAWNTLCLPFALGNDYAEAGHHFDGTPLEGATVMELDATGDYSGKHTGLTSDGTLYLYFKDATSIVAGRPYIIRWGTPDSHPTTNLVDPVFSGVNIDKADRSVTSTDGSISFKGTYSPVSIGTNGDNTLLYLGMQNKLYWPNAAMTIGCQRAYFQLLGGLTASPNPSEGGEPVRAFNLNFGDDSLPQGGDGEGLGINAQPMFNVQSSMFNEEAWYDIQGRRVQTSNFKLQTSKLNKGLYIHNGRKVVIK